MSAARERRVYALLAGLIVLLGLGLRTYHLGAQSFWNDEGTTIMLAQRDLPTIVRNASSDIHPPLYYFLLHLWTQLLGSSEWAARLLSALVGAATVPLVYSLARRFFGVYVALGASLLTAISPFLIYYSQEARMYALVAFLGAAATWAFCGLLALGEGTRARDRRHWRWAVGYLLLSVAAVYTHYFAFSILLAHNLFFVVWFLITWRQTPAGHRARRFWGWAGLQLVITGAYLPWLVLSWGALRSWPAVSEPLTLGDLLLRLAVVFPLGVTVEGSLLQRLVGVALGLLALLGLAVPASREPSEQSRWGRMLFALTLGTPIAVIYLMSLTRPLYKPKFLLLAAPPYAILLALAIVIVAAALTNWLKRLHWRPIGAALRALTVAAIMMLVAIPSLRALDALYHDPRYARDDYRGIVAYINETASPQDAILINAPSQIETVDYYYDGPLPMVPLPLERPLNVERTSAALEHLVQEHRRVYGIFWATDESDPDRYIESWLDQHAFKTMDTWYGALRLVVYAVPERGSGQMEQPTAYRLGATSGSVPGVDIRLRGYTLHTPVLQPGEIVQVTLYWEAIAPVAERYKVFVHLLDASGTRVAQRDAEPGGGAALTTTWRPGEVVVDNYGIVVPADAAPGEYQLLVGLYALDGGERLPVSQEGQPLGDVIPLASLGVTPGQVQLPDARQTVEQEGPA